MSPESLRMLHLKQFAGSEQLFKHGLVRDVCYTEGVRYLAEKAGAYWLIDMVAFGQSLPAVAAEEFQVWTLRVALHNQRGLLTCEDGNGRGVYEYQLRYTDFPMKEIKLFFTGTVLMLASEY